ncbi:uncharacterized protein LOC128885060 [Hylaeus volcanicus]|uniref:uncharacterized protein LOC128885060 n=1 Tax=Hylaeus volcanicus TaxID=313075 RepID=UPI0023B8291B|nr:uncharacterized protein LOC128885060 [Hylaeus volcanicus]
MGAILVLDQNNKAGGVSTAVGAETFAQLKRPEVIINQQPWERIDDGNADDVKMVQRAGKKNGKGTIKSRPLDTSPCSRKRKRKQREREARAKLEAEKQKLKTEEEERLRKWEECWERKLREQEERDNVECCMAKGLCSKPRTRSNIWVNVSRDRSIQTIHMTFKHAPVPRPKPPPLPPPKTSKPPKTSEHVSTDRTSGKRIDKKIGTRGTKKK